MQSRSRHACMHADRRLRFEKHRSIYYQPGSTLFLHLAQLPIGPVAQWIRHRPTEPGIAGSSPAGVISHTLLQLVVLPSHDVSLHLRVNPEAIYSHGNFVRRPCIQSSLHVVDSAHHPSPPRHACTQCALKGTLLAARPQLVVCKYAKLPR